MATYTPSPLRVWTQLDDIGACLSLPRSPNEGNDAYRFRILKIYIERANSTYEGLINGINNEFGYEKYMGMTIIPTGLAAQAYPYVAVTASSIIIYPVLVTGHTLAKTTVVIDYMYTGEDGYVAVKNMREVADEIEALDDWTVSLDSDYDEQSCRRLMIQSNVKLQRQFNLPTTNRIVLDDKTNIVENTWSFTEKDVFKTYIPWTRPQPDDDPYDLLSEEGDFTADLENGILYTYSLPSGYGFCDFEYRISPYQLVCTPCNVYGFDDSDFMSALYMDYEGKEYYPSFELMSYIRELFTVSKQTWGE